MSGPLQWESDADKYINKQINPDHNKDKLVMVLYFSGCSRPGRQHKITHTVPAFTQTV